MPSFDFVVEYSNGAEQEVTVVAFDEKEARSVVWQSLSHGVRDAVVGIECVEQYAITER